MFNKLSAEERLFKKQKAVLNKVSRLLIDEKSTDTCFFMNFRGYYPDLQFYKTLDEEFAVVCKERKIPMTQTFEGGAEEYMCKSTIRMSKERFIALVNRDEVLANNAMVLGQLQRTHSKKYLFPDAILTKIMSYNTDSEKAVQSASKYLKKPNGSMGSIVDTLIKNIETKKSGRIACFSGARHENKISKLKVISAWLHQNPQLGEQCAGRMAALLKHVCAIKRNSWGLFAPHSVGELNTLLKSYNNKLEITKDFPTAALSLWEQQDCSLEGISQLMGIDAMTTHTDRIAS